MLSSPKSTEANTSTRDREHFHQCKLFTIGVDLAGILGGTHGERRRWVGAAWGRVWGGVSLPQPTMGSGEHFQLPQRGPSENEFWRILKAAAGRSFCIYMTKSEGDNLH